MMEHEEILHIEKFLDSISIHADVDILFECFIGLLIKEGIANLESIHVIPAENHRRNYRNDIIPIPEKDAFRETKFLKESNWDFSTLYTSRSSILDYLPEGFFSSPDNSDEIFDIYGNRKTEQEVEAYRKKIRQEAKSAQLFFNPLEVEYNKIRVYRELNEVNELDDFNQSIQLFWKEFPSKKPQWQKFRKTLHLIPHILGDEKKTKALIEYVLDKSISLSFFIEESFEISEKEKRALLGNEEIMGLNMTVGNTIYDYLEVCILKIGNLSSSEFLEYFDEGSQSKKLINEILKYYFPLNLDVRLDFSIIEKKENEDGQFAIPIVGYSSKLGV